MESEQLSEETKLRVALLFPPEQQDEVPRLLAEGCGNNLPSLKDGATLFGDHMTAHAFTMKDLADLLSDPSCGLGRPVIDDTALTTAYDFTLAWSPQMRNLIPGPDSTAPSPDEAVNVFSALRELGLKLQPSTGPMDTIVIDHVERPSAN